MYSYIVRFLALVDDISFKVSSHKKETIEKFVEDILKIFAALDADQQLTINGFQRNSRETIEKISQFVDNYSSVAPELKSLPSFFKKMGENTPFFFMSSEKTQKVDTTRLLIYLETIDIDVSYDERLHQHEELFGELKSNYKINSYGDRRITIGERIKKKRVCRLCSKKEPMVTFKNVAHAISEALGNKNVILYDECDKCNSDFNKSTEQDIVTYLSLFRTFFNVKGKGGSKKIKGDNFKIQNDGNSVQMEIYQSTEASKRNENSYKLSIEPSSPITLQNIYKTFCKYFISVVPSDELSNFTETIKWIRGETDFDELPTIAELLSYHSFSTQPKLVTYLRKNEDNSLPYAVGEFHFTCRIFVFIIPLASKGSKTFHRKDDFDSFWSTFKHLNLVQGWSFKDYSDSQARKMTLNLNFEKAGSNPDK